MLVYGKLMTVVHRNIPNVQTKNENTKSTIAELLLLISASIKLTIDHPLEESHDLESSV